MSSPRKALVLYQLDAPKETPLSAQVACKPNAGLEPWLPPSHSPRSNQPPAARSSKALLWQVLTARGMCVITKFVSTGCANMSIFMGALCCWSKASDFAFPQDCTLLPRQSFRLAILHRLLTEPLGCLRAASLTQSATQWRPTSQSGGESIFKDAL